MTYRFVLPLLLMFTPMWSACGDPITCSEGQVEVSGLCVDVDLEVCDGLDNDLDGDVDEDCGCSPPGATQACGTDTGICSRGIQTCQSDGRWGLCAGQIAPSEERCDGLDNDCNGEIDDAAVACTCLEGDTRRCGPESDAGQCVFGTQTCDEKGMWGACTGAILPSEEVCDGVDNDCDGVEDLDDGCECIVGDQEVCGETDVGECEFGTRSCVDGAWGACLGQVVATPEICDTKDNDCDGTPDNGNPGGGEDCGSDVGQCRAGVLTCQNGDLVCVGEQGAEEESCDGLDNDCDGEIDNGPAFQCAQGSALPACTTSCGSIGRRFCSESCTIPASCTPPEEICNYADDDCDDKVDETVMHVEKVPLSSGIGSLAKIDGGFVVGAQQSTTNFVATLYDLDGSQLDQRNAIGFQGAEYVSMGDSNGVVYGIVGLFQDEGVVQMLQFQRDGSELDVDVSKTVATSLFPAHHASRPRIVYFANGFSAVTLVDDGVLSFGYETFFKDSLNSAAVVSGGAPAVNFDAESITHVVRGWNGTTDTGTVFSVDGLGLPEADHVGIATVGTARVLSYIDPDEQLRVAETTPDGCLSGGLCNEIIATGQTGPTDVVMRNDTLFVVAGTAIYAVSSAGDAPAGVPFDTIVRDDWGGTASIDYVKAVQSGMSTAIVQTGEKNGSKQHAVTFVGCW